MRLSNFIGLALLTMTACTTTVDAPPDVVTELAPSGTLRAAINYGNPLLATLDARTDEPAGVSVDLARALAKRLKVQLQLVPFQSAGSVVAAGSRNEWDVAFVARDPVRAQTLLQTAPYLAIEGAYLVRINSPLQRNEEVDRPGTSVVVGRGSAYDLFLTRELKAATIVRVDSSQAVTAQFLHGGYDVAAGVKQQLLMDTRGRTDVRLLPGRFMQIDQAMATPAGRVAAHAYLEAFVAEEKRSGAIAASLAAHHTEGAIVAP